MKLTVLATILVISFLYRGVHGLLLPRSPFCGDAANFEGILCPTNTIPGGSCHFKSFDTQDKSNTNQCYHLEDPPDGAVVAEGLINVSINPYRYTGHLRSRVNLNVTITNIKCTEFVLLLTVNGTDINKCFKLAMSNVENVPKTSALFWDCRWFPPNYSEWPITLQYRASYGLQTEYRKFHFKLPNINNIDVEVTDSKDLEVLIYREDYTQCINFYWSRPAAKYNILTYQVILNELGDNQSEHKPVDVIQTNETNISFCKIPKFGTQYNISVQPWIKIGDTHSWGRQSFSEPFFTDPPPLGSSIASLVALSILLLFLIVFCCIYITRIFLYKYMSKFKKCVIVYEPTSENHLNVVRELSIFLQSIHGPVLFAETEIRDKDATDWWGMELNDADLILIVSNPPTISHEDMYRASTFAPVFEKGFVRETLRNLVRNSTLPKRYLKILLPYCGKNDFYDFLRPRQSYHIFKDRFMLLQKIFGSNFMLPPCISCLFYSSAFKTKSWENLKSAIKNFKSDKTIISEVTYANDDESQQSLTSVQSGSEEESDAEEQRNRQLVLMAALDDDSSSLDSDMSSYHHSSEDQQCDTVLDSSKVHMIKEGMKEIDNFFGIK